MSFSNYLIENFGYTKVKKETEEGDLPDNKSSGKSPSDKPKVTSGGSKEYDVRTLAEVFDTDEQPKYEGYIVDACKELKISIRAVVFETNGIVVHYNFGSEAPTGYRDDKNEIAKDVKSEVTDILDEAGFKVKRYLRSTVEDGVASITFIASPKW